MNKPRKAIFFDRDGVLNHAVIKNGKPYPPADLESLSIVEDATEALNALKRAGFLLIGATNQPDVARGITTKDMVEAINAKLLATLPLEEIRVCYHDDHHACDCRKPLPGLLVNAADDYNINLTESIMIGDRWKDIEAGQRAGCKTVWIKQNYDEAAPKIAPDFVAASLRESAEWILQKDTKGV